MVGGRKARLHRVMGIYSKKGILVIRSHDSSTSRRFDVSIVVADFLREEVTVKRPTRPFNRASLAHFETVTRVNTGRVIAFETARSV